MKLIFSIGFCFLFAFSSLAQREGKPKFDKEKLKAAKIAFITQRMDITPEQATKFWPLYNDYEDNRDKKVRELREISHQDEGQLTDEKALSFIQKRFLIQQELLDLEKEFTKKISEILTPIQVFEFHKVDRDFVRHLYRMQKRKHKDEKESTGFLPWAPKSKITKTPTLYQLAENLAISNSIEEGNHYCN
ncbi:hypothetical protein QWY93_01450 [Echinicola jeungdonensis]|uniref:Spy/CpxP family protein refolding chaperone n=1 Tax=Echinicola jeungdonensis TaxID=709343 RepID=A0ABV5J4M7_9BACT|nr:hypothetical protein [Echinicola jeungdonensis]MDN3668007.1 hypothetical protein [Echinicola jeungdonensis]